jgi:hypothetical protein
MKVYGPGFAELRATGLPICGSKPKPLANAKLPQLSLREFRYLGCGDRI